MKGNKTSLKFKHMSKNTTRLVYAILENEDFIKYVYHLGNYNPKTKDISSIELRSVKDKSIILNKFKEDILKDSKVLIFFNPFKGSFAGGSTSDDIYTMDIVVPYKYWVIEETSELRAFSIAHEVARTIDQKNIVGIGDVKIIDWESYKVNKDFSGLSMMIKVTNSSLVEG